MVSMHEIAKVEFTIPDYEPVLVFAGLYHLISAARDKCVWHRQGKICTNTARQSFTDTLDS